MNSLLHALYSPSQMIYDQRRLRLTGLIWRIGHTYRYVLTPDWIKVAVFYTKLHNRLLRPCSPASPRRPQNLRPPSAPSTSMSTATSPARGSPRPGEI
jgi:hypothetical protein